MVDASSLANHFLIAMPTLADPNFFRTVTYICEHNREGAVGIIINRPLDLTLGQILDHMGIQLLEPSLGQQPVFLGGPVQRERGFVIHEPVGGWDSSLGVTDTVGLTSSRDILMAMAQGGGPRRSLVALGYAGWGAGQLEQELATNAWLSGPADLRVLFDTPAEQRWQAAAALLLGDIDINLLSGEVGHA